MVHLRLLRAASAGCAAALLLLPPASLAAQRMTPSLGASIGTTSVPRPLVSTCGDERMFTPTLEVSAGVTSGRLRADARAAAVSALTFVDCVMAPRMYPDGIHTEAVYRGRDVDFVAITALAHYAPVESFSLGAGAGRLSGAGAPFLLVTAGYRSRGRVAFVAEAQARATRLRYDLVTSEWKDMLMVRTISRNTDTEWHSGFGARIGAELRLH